MLPRRQWNILDCCADQDEPIEQVYSAYADDDRTVDPALMLSDLLQLFRIGFITIRQVPIPWCGQAFVERGIVPNRPEDIVGDLGDSFAKFRRNRDYLRYESDCTLGDSGIPFGIWIDMTTEGRKEWERPEYDQYWCDELI